MEVSGASPLQTSNSHSAIQSPQNPLTESLVPTLQVDQTWNLESIFPTVAEWEAAYKELSAGIGSIKAYQGRLGESGQILLEALELSDQQQIVLGKLSTYANLKYYGDTRDSSAQSLNGRVSQLSSNVRSAHAFIEPEILALGRESIEEFKQNVPALSRYEFLLSELERTRAHTCSSEIERVLAALSPSLSTPEEFHTALNNGDLRFSPITVNGEQIAVTHGNIDALMGSPNRAIRQAAYASFNEPYLNMANTFTMALTQQAQISFRFANLRNFDSTLDQLLFRENLPRELFTTILDVCSEHAPLMQRYFRVKAKLLGIDKIAEYDIEAPLGQNAPKIEYPKAIEIVLESLAPMGKDYQDIARTGLCQERWVDVNPREGKYSNAFSSSTYGCNPFILLNYAQNMTSVGTLAHELGHSVHSLFTNSNQPRCYSGYSSMVAETASNLNQVLLRDFVLETADRDTTLAIMDEAFHNIHRYLFLFPTLSRVEHFIHATYTSGGAISSDDLSAFTADAFSKGYGDSVEFDSKSVGIKLSQFSHVFAPYYLFQYAVGISAAMAIGQQILDGDTSVRDKFRNVLTLGSSQSTSELFASVGVDITSPAPYRSAFSLVERYVTRLEELASTSS